MEVMVPTSLISQRQHKHQWLWSSRSQVTPFPLLTARDRFEGRSQAQNTSVFVEPDLLTDV